MTSIRGYAHLYKKRLFITLPDFFLPPKSGDELFDQPVGPLGENFPITVISTATFFVPKYTKEDL